MPSYFTHLLVSSVDVVGIIFACGGKLMWLDITSDVCVTLHSRLECLCVSFTDCHMLSPVQSIGQSVPTGA